MSTENNIQWTIITSVGFIGPFKDAASAGQHIQDNWGMLANPRIEPLHAPKKITSIGDKL